MHYLKEVKTPYQQGLGIGHRQLQGPDGGHALQQSVATDVALFHRHAGALFRHHPELLAQQ